MIGCLPTQALAFLAVFVYAKQAIAFEWKPGFRLTVLRRASLTKVCKLKFATVRQSAHCIWVTGHFGPPGHFGTKTFRHWCRTVSRTLRHHRLGIDSAQIVSICHLPRIASLSHEKSITQESNITDSFLCAVCTMQIPRM